MILNQHKLTKPERRTGSEGPGTEPLAQPELTERHFSTKVLAELWGYSESTVRRIFQDEPGVLKVGTNGRRDGKRDYCTLRIPESVARRVYRRITS